MTLNKGQKILAALASISAGVLVAMIAFAAPITGTLTGGVTLLAAVILYDRTGRQLWEQSVSHELKSLRENQQDLAVDIRQTGEDIQILTGHVKEAADAVQKATARRVRHAPAQDNTMPLALRPGEKVPVNYEELVPSNGELSDRAVKELTAQAARSGKIELFLQPVVRLPQRKVRFYEIFARVPARPGLYLPASRYMKIARETNQMHAMDALLLGECLDIIRETASLERASPFFINISAETLKNAAYMKKLLAFLSVNRSLASRLIFEIPQADYQTLTSPVMQIMRGLGKLGCEFSIDNVRNFNFDIAALQRLKIRYVKINARTLIPQTGQDKKFADILRMKRKLEGNGIAVIAEKIENEKTVREILDFDVNHGQGFLFGKPDIQGAYQQKNVKQRRFI